jgi:predicted HicB family RNase H-like nuclease
MSENSFRESINKGTNTAADDTAEEATRAASEGEDVEEAQLNVRLPKPLHEAFRRQAKNNAQQMSALVRNWIREYVRKDE